MKLKKIRLQGFRKHNDSTLDLGDSAFVVIRGTNHSGKSSIGQGISMGLTPSTSSLDPQGRGFTRKIKRGETKSVITLDIQGKHLIQQTVVLNTNTSGRTSRATCLDDESWKPLPFENFLTRYKDALLIVCNSDYFLNHMDEKAQKALLAKLALPERYDFPPETIAAVESAIGEKVIDFNGEPFSVIDKAYKKLYDERAILNRQVKELIITEPLGGPNAGSLPAMMLGVDSTALQKQLEEAREERHKVADKQYAAMKEASAASQKRGELSNKVTNLREKCREIDTRIKGLAESILSPEKLAELQKIVERAEKHKKLSDRQAEIQREVNEANREIERFSKLSGDDATCPTCDQSITEDYVAKTLKAGKNLIAERTAEAAKVAEELTKIGDVDAASASITKHLNAANEKDELAKTLAEKVKEGKAAVGELNKLGGAVDVGAPFVEPLAALDTKIKGIEEQLRPVIAAEERAEDIRKKTQAKAKLQEKAGSIDKLVEFFGKDGIKAKLLAEHVGGFERKVAAVLEAWNYKCDISIDPWIFDVTVEPEVTVPVEELSDSEALLFFAAMQCAVSIAAGIGFVVIDRMDTMVPNLRHRLYGNLVSMIQQGVLEQAIVIETNEDQTMPSKPAPNSAYFFVEDGNVRRIR